MLVIQGKDGLDFTMRFCHFFSEVHKIIVLMLFEMSSRHNMVLLRKEEPVELTEKQKMANMLFGGSGRSKRTQKRGRKARPAKKGTKTAAAKRSPQAVVPQPVVQKKDEPADLLDLSALGGSGPKQPVNRPASDVY